ncbi:glycine cleavage system aminomethyltransferase GcvT [Sesbania bispinosa]|nr:glycine cleavage system aminomethyltransferase GcvT [Sesbania bispinosa]
MASTFDVAGPAQSRGDDPTLIGAGFICGLGQNGELRGWQPTLDVLGQNEELNARHVGSNNQLHLRDSAGLFNVSKEQVSSRVDVDDPRDAVGVAQVGPTLAHDAPTLIKGERNCGTELSGTVHLEEEILNDTVPETQFHSLSDNEENQDL